MHVEGGSVRGRTNRVLPMQIVNRCRRSLPSLTTPLPDSCLCAPHPPPPLLLCSRYCCVPDTDVSPNLLLSQFYWVLRIAVFLHLLYSCYTYLSTTSICLSIGRVSRHEFFFVSSNKTIAVILPASSMSACQLVSYNTTLLSPLRPAPSPPPPRRG